MLALIDVADQLHTSGIFPKAKMPIQRLGLVNTKMFELFPWKRCD